MLEISFHKLGHVPGSGKAWKGLLSLGVMLARMGHGLLAEDVAAAVASLGLEPQHLGAKQSANSNSARASQQKALIWLAQQVEGRWLASSQTCHANFRSSSYCSSCSTQSVPASAVSCSNPWAVTSQRTREWRAANHHSRRRCGGHLYEDSSH